jgi:hypothetical protein
MNLLGRQVGFNLEIYDEVQQRGHHLEDEDGFEIALINFLDGWVTLLYRQLS